MSNCKHCGQPFEPSDRNYSGNGHFNPYTCISNLRARAELAEAELEEAQAQLMANEERIDEDNRFRDNLIAALGYEIKGDMFFLDDVVAEAAALRARVAELEAEHYALRQRLITAAQAALPGDVTITRMIVGWTDRLTGPQHIVLIGDEEE